MINRNNIFYVTVRAHPGSKLGHNTFKDVPLKERDDVFSQKELIEARDLINKRAETNDPIPVSIEHTYLLQSLHPDKKVPQLKTGYVSNAWIDPKDNNCLLASLAFDIDNPYDALALKCIKSGFLKEVSLSHTGIGYSGPDIFADHFQNLDPKKQVFEISLCAKGRREDTVIFDPDLVLQRTSHAASAQTLVPKRDDSLIRSINEIDLNVLNDIKQTFNL